MFTDIAVNIQKNLGYEPLLKMSPNSDELPTGHHEHGIRSVSQAAIPAVLLALYHYAQYTEGSWELLHKTEHDNWLAMVFGSRKEELTERISGYASQSREQTEVEIRHILKEAVRLLQTRADVNKKNGVTAILDGQRKFFVQYLPPSLHLGSLLENAPVDDNTHKMSGPVSGFMHTIEKQFNTNDTTVRK